MHFVYENIEDGMKEREEALDRTLWRTRFGRDCGPVVRQTVEWRHLCVNTILIRRTSGHSVGTFKQSGALANVEEHRTEKNFRIVLLASGLKTVMCRAAHVIGRVLTTCDAMVVLAQSCTCTLKYSAVAGHCPGCVLYVTYCSCLRGQAAYSTVVNRHIAQ
jgi:hypothetical protein